MSESRQLAAIVFSDISGFTHTMESDENCAMAQIQKHREIVTNVIQEFNGEMLKEMGDGILLKFTSAIEAVRCANQIQTQTETEDFNLKIGIHLGDVIIKDNDIFGSGVNIASRIHEHGDPGSICISNEVWLQIKNQTDINAKSLGNKKLKGVDGEVTVYQVASGVKSETQISFINKDKVSGKPWSLAKKILFPLTGLILTIIGGAFWFIYPFLTIGMGNVKEYDASIAILYMENISPDEKSYFADGLTEELITRLSRIQNLKVRPRTDVAFFKNKTATMDEISKKLSVNYIVEGSVKIIDNNLRVNVMLFDIDKDDVTWSDSYNNTLKDILNVQDEIANSIVSKLNEKLTITKSDLIASERRTTENLEAYNLVMKAYQHINNPIYTERKLGEIIEPLTQKAIELDSTYSDAYTISALAKFYKWLNRTTKEGTALREEEINDKAMAVFHANTAMHYDENNILASALVIMLSTLWDISYELTDTQKIINARNMMIETKRLLKKYPDDIFCQTTYAFFLSIKNNILNAEDEEYQEPLDRMLKVHHKLKNNNFVYNHPTEQMAAGFIFNMVPQLYVRVGQGEKSMPFVIDNKHNFCADGTYNCLNARILTEIGNGFYHSLKYEHALEIINMILSQSEEDLLYVGNTINDKKMPYYRSGMIYMKWGKYNKAITGFTEALKLSFENANNQYWNAHFYRRLGLVYYFKGDYINASKNYLEAYKLSKTVKANKVKDNKMETIKILCSYGYVEELLGNHELAKEKMDECANWASENPIKESNDFPGDVAYQTIWPLYLYHKNINKLEKASKYLTMAYETIGKKAKDKYHTHTEKDTDPYFFYCRDIIKAYESSLNQ